MPLRDAHGHDDMRALNEIDVGYGDRRARWRARPAVAHGPAALTSTRARHSIRDAAALKRHDDAVVRKSRSQQKVAGMASSPPSVRAESTTARVSCASSVCAS